MADDDQSPSTSASWPSGGIHGQLLAVVENAGSQELSSGLVEDIRAALNVIAQSSPSLNSVSSSSVGRPSRARGETVVIINVDGSPGDIENATERILDLNSERITDGETTTGGDNDLELGSNRETEDNAADAGIHREIRRLRVLSQNRELQKLWTLLRHIVPFTIILFLKLVIDFFPSLLMLLVASSCFHLANVALVVSLGEKRYLHLLQSNSFSILFFGFHYYMCGFDPLLIPMSFRTYFWDPITFFSTLHSVLVTDLAVKHITVQIKVVIAAIPRSILSSKRRRRIFQWVEYTSQIYRYLLPIPQWNRYFSYSRFTSPIIYYSDHIFTFFYVLSKLYLMETIGRLWLNSTRFLCRFTSIGTSPSSAELDYIQQCGICVSDFDHPIKLSCGHIFCEECIGTWLDKECTCPMCRATIAPEDNKWKSGETTYSPQVC